MTDGHRPGNLVWTDLTVTNADEVRDFYSRVVGWTPSPVSMGDYDDYAMVPPGGGPEVAGICHAKGPNVDLPSQWLLYIAVADLDQSMAECVRLGGKILAGPKNLGPRARYCVIEDPGGAVAALYAENKEQA